MIKQINIEYCDANEKYDIFVDGEWLGKFYTLVEALKSVQKYNERKVE